MAFGDSIKIRTAITQPWKQQLCQNDKCVRKVSFSRQRKGGPEKGNLASCKFSWHLSTRMLFCWGSGIFGFTKDKRGEKNFKYVLKKQHPGIVIGAYILYFFFCSKSSIILILELKLRLRKVKTFPQEGGRAGIWLQSHLLQVSSSLCPISKAK